MKILSPGHWFPVGVFSFNVTYSIYITFTFLHISCTSCTEVDFSTYHIIVLEMFNSYI